MAPSEYQKLALRTLAPDLTLNERLTLGGLGLGGESGEVLDILKKYLLHRNNKPLDMAKIKDELGDVLWYIALLIDTLNLTFEEVLEANIAKLEKRHTNGFVSSYASDSGSSL